MIFIKIILTLTLIGIAYQDIKTREVYWFTFPLFLISAGSIHYYNVLNIHFFYSIIINLGVISTIAFILFLYASLKLKKPLFKEAFGIGDLLIFIALAFAFPTYTFITLFCFSLVFSSLLWVFLSSKSINKTVPLAGYISLFLVFVYSVSWTTHSFDLYSI